MLTMSVPWGSMNVEMKGGGSSQNISSKSTKVFGGSHG